MHNALIPEKPSVLETHSSKTTNSDKPTAIAPELVRAVTTDVLKQNYLGSGNKIKRETGNLNTYYLNLARYTYRKYFENRDSSQVSPDIHVFLQASMVFYLGVGNCGELTAALIAKLFTLSELNSSQKLTIERYTYPSNDAHKHNAYIKIGTIIFNIWDDGKEWNEEAFYKKIGVLKTNHTQRADFKKHVNAPAEKFSSWVEIFTENFGAKFEEGLKKHRRTGKFYPTTDNADKSKFAILVVPAFTYLAKKFFETFTDQYFVERPEIAVMIRRKIVKDFVYLIEELRQDYPIDVAKFINRPGRKKLSDLAIKDILNQCVSNPLLVNYLMVVSYRNFHPTLFEQALKTFSLSAENPHGKTLAEWVFEQWNQLNNAPKEKTRSGIPEVINRGQHPVFQRENSLRSLNQENTTAKSEESSCPEFFL